MEIQVATDSNMNTLIDMLYIKIVVLDFDLFTKKVRANTIKEKLIKAKNESNGYVLIAPTIKTNTK
jgi:hypothetical protein